MVIAIMVGTFEFVGTVEHYLDVVDVRKKGITKSLSGRHSAGAEFVKGPAKQCQDIQTI